MLLARHAAAAAASLRTSTSSPRIARSVITATRRQYYSPTHAASIVRVPLLSSTASFSTSARRTSEDEGAGKVEALPFALDPLIARLTATSYAVSQSKGTFAGLAYSTCFVLKELLGIAGPANWMEASARVDRCEAVYLPYWIVDVNFKIQAKNEALDEPVRASMASVNSRMPGFDWQPMRSLPLAPPDAGEAAYQVFQEELLDGPEKAFIAATGGNDAAARAKDDKRPKRATLVPFAASPLTLPTLLSDAEAAPLQIKVPRILAVSDEELKSGDPSVLEPPKPDKIKFMGETLDVDMLATYPILLPMYITKFKPVVNEEGVKEEPMVVVQPAWKATAALRGTLFITGGAENMGPLAELLPRWSIRSWPPVPSAMNMLMALWAPMVKLSAPYFYPSVPLVPFKPQLKGSRKAAKRTGRSGGKAKGQDAESSGATEIGSLSQQIGHATIQGQIIAAAHKWLTNGDWTALKAKEAEAAEARAAKKTKSSDEAQAELGDVDWDDMRVQRFSEQSGENGAYLEAQIALLDKHIEQKMDPTFTDLLPEDSKLKEDPDETVQQLEETASSLQPDWLARWRRGEQTRTGKEKGKPDKAKHAEL